LRLNSCTKARDPSDQSFQRSATRFMNTIKAILFEPVGCLAEFPAGPFNEILTRCLGLPPDPKRTSSIAYWQAISAAQPPASAMALWEELELATVRAASVYEDAEPALLELKTMGVQVLLTTSLSGAATSELLGKFSDRWFSVVEHRDNLGGAASAPLLRALSRASIQPQHAVYLTDTADGIRLAKGIGVNPVLMMNDPDEARRLAMLQPSGGIVSLHELPDFVRLVTAENLQPQRVRRTDS